MRVWNMPSEEKTRCYYSSNDDKQQVLVDGDAVGDNDLKVEPVVSIQVIEIQ